MKMQRAAMVAMLAVGFSALAGAQPAASLEGAWRVSESIVTGANAATNRSPQPGLLLFTKQHYSLITVNGATPRKAYGTAADAAKLTEAERAARYEAWDKFSANSGTYEVSGGRLTTRAQVAKNPTVMEGNPVVREFKIEGNMLTLVRKSAEGQPVSETTSKWTRVE
jgi:hypothetical protein